MLNRVKHINKPSGGREARIIPAWDKLAKCLVTLSESNAIPDKHDRYLLDEGIRTRIPSSAGRAVKAIETFMLDWLNQAVHRETLTERISNNPSLSNVRLLIGKPDKNGNVNLSLSTPKGFIVVAICKDRFEA
ncbi:hypothetical protein pEaSNUABM37_00127 [Erwinia phage pEa_SNUABM_37]|nr:hypothetical protein pEaSNUABM37_00127 [Erwinia phage pEa_SNUABM_37]QXO10597.1 hypothetical protein pEaSNUABM48_00127 [Erwinia phage pEa_SNUABM_48]